MNKQDEIATELLKIVNKLRQHEYDYIPDMTMKVRELKLGDIFTYGRWICVSKGEEYGTWCEHDDTDVERVCNLRDEPKSDPVRERAEKVFNTANQRIKNEVQFATAGILEDEQKILVEEIEKALREGDKK